MKVALFYHSLISDWNHGNAHFLRGVAGELLARGHTVRVFEHADAWSVENLVRDHGPSAIAAFHHAYPALASERYSNTFDLDAALDGVDLVIVHECTDPALVARIGKHRARHRYTLLFHDTYHRAMTAPHEIAAYDLEHYDAVLAACEMLADLYSTRGWARRAWAWHEAADTRMFIPRIAPTEGDLVWIGNWRDAERGRELRELVIAPVRTLGLRARVYGVRYPSTALAELAAARITYSGWLPNFEVPDVFARHRITVHIPRRPHADTLPGIAGIRMFEALACGIPLVSAPWDDIDGLFSAGHDYVVAASGTQMERRLFELHHDRAWASELAAHGRATVLARHTCAHRVDELLEIAGELGTEVGSSR